MADITWSIVVEHVPALADPVVPLNVQTDLLGLVNNLLNVRAWGGEDSFKYKMARIYLLAHLATYPKGDGAQTAGPVISESEGGLSRSYAVMATASADDPHWGKTTFGSSYVALLRTLVWARLPFVPGARG